MRINTKLRLSVWVPVCMALIIGLTVLFSYPAMKKAQHNGDLVRQIRSSITELNNFAYSYIFYHEERPKQQFLKEYESLTRLISGIRLRDSQQQRLVENIRVNSEGMKDLFFRMVSNYEHADLVKSDKLFKEADERLAGQLLIKSRNVDADASLLRSLVDNDLNIGQTRTIALIVLLTVLATIPLTAVLARTRKGIISSLAALGKGTEALGAGNLAHRIGISGDDELTELAHSFDDMVDKLQAVTVSKDVLQKEVEERKQAEEELRRQRELLAVTLASIGDAVIVTDTNGRVTFINGEAEHLTGWASGEALGQPLASVFNIINEQTRQAVESPVDKVLRLGVVVGLANHTVLIAKDGREIPIDDSGAPIRGADGAVYGVVLVFRDFTEQKKAENEIHRHVGELLRLNNAMTGRELRMLELKKEVNDLCERLGQQRRYSVDFDKELS
jgi:PAS domain S-box-containing protein